MKAGIDNEYVNMIIEQEVSSKSPVILAGFPGIGLVGNIVATQIASELKMTQMELSNLAYFRLLPCSLMDSRTPQSESTKILKTTSS